MVFHSKQKKQRTRILFYAPRFHTNQVPVVKAIQAAGHEVYYLVLHKSKSEDYSTLSPVLIQMNWLWMLIETILPFLKHPMKRMKWGMPKLMGLRQEIKKFNPDQVVFRGDPIRNVPNLFMWFVCLAFRVPIVIYSQDPICGGDPSRGRRFSYWLFLKVLKYTWYSPVLGQSEEYEPRLGIIYLPFVQDVQVESSLAGTQNSALEILVVGKMFPRKNHRLLIQALAKLKDDYNFKLKIIGECSTLEHEQELAQLKDLIAELELKDLVEIQLNLQLREVHSCYDKADIFVLPSTQEAASVSNLEAMAHGVMVICSNTNGTSIYTTDGYDGFIFKDNDLESLKSTLRKALASPNNLHRMGENALKTVKKNHPPALIVEFFNKLCLEGKE